ncbi:transmembrane emp24 domain-containing protein 6-like [Haliotis rufescens]|uniref:transmembrane emp24 domain-containing protein 6-like n=1 Tax=Haliotis rufescens TaxID=6454 RepID=UPI00201F5E04|nr:transmembrane emp24 domain-containing protein 6-like [Haliotis rufescens]
MATRYYYHVLTTLLITNRLFPVSTETVLGENVDEEFDFDGLPGVQHEFKVEVAAGKEECFYQFATQGSRLYVSYDVLRGGDRNINFFLLDQNQVVVESHYDKPDAMVETDVKEQGYYQVCFDNTQSRFGSRLVYFYLVTIVMEKWIQYMKDVVDIQDLAVNLSSILYGVELSLTDVDQYQMHSRLNVMRDWYLLNENQRYVGYWSVALCVVVLVAGVGQVVFLRRMFRMPTVTPTSKPRA